MNRVRAVQAGIRVELPRAHHPKSQRAGGRAASRIAPRGCRSRSASARIPAGVSATHGQVRCRQPCGRKRTEADAVSTCASGCIKNDPCQVGPRWTATKRRSSRPGLEDSRARAKRALGAARQAVAPYLSVAIRPWPRRSGGGRRPFRMAWPRPRCRIPWEMATSAVAQHSTSRSSRRCSGSRD